MIYLWNFHSRWPWSKYVDCFAFSRSQLNNRKVKWWEIQFYNNKWAERCHQQTISVNFWKNKGEGRWLSWDGIEIQRSHSSEHVWKGTRAPPRASCSAEPSRSSGMETQSPQRQKWDVQLKASDCLKVNMWNTPNNRNFMEKMRKSIVKDTKKNLSHKFNKSKEQVQWIKKKAKDTLRISWNFRTLRIEKRS